jgi:ribulose-5-phosphate 4-epimerase/fuculose-1-phosphate aldolase
LTLKVFDYATRTCLGLLTEDDIVLARGDGRNEDLDPKPSSEWRLHAAVYQSFTEIDAVMHVHSLHTNAFFLKNQKLKPEILEASYLLGKIPVIPQETLNVEDTTSVCRGAEK